MTPDQLAATAAVVQTVAIVVGLGFAVKQLRQGEKDRCLQSILRVFEEMHHPDAYTLREGLLMREVDLERLTHSEVRQLVGLVDFFERVSFLCRSKLLKQSYVLELYSGIIVQMWDRLSPFVQRSRGSIKPTNWAIGFEKLSTVAGEYRSAHFPADDVLVHYDTFPHDDPSNAMRAQ